MKLNTQMQNCLNSAQKFNDIKTWKGSKPRTYSVAEANGWLDSCTAHMLPTDDDWTVERCAEFAEPYFSKMEWRENDPIGYRVARQKRYLDQVDGRVFKRKLREQCVGSALKFKTKVSWEQAEPELYGIAYKNGMIKACTAHMIDCCVKWNEQMCLESATRYTTRSEWKEAEPRAVSAANRLKIMSKCTEHMETPFRWTLNSCSQVAKLHTSKDDWKKADPESYMAALTNDWLLKCTSHMKVVKTTKQLCMESAKRFSSKTEWATKDKNMYRLAQRHGIVRLCTEHMSPECEADLRFVKSRAPSAPKDVSSKQYCLEQAKKYGSVSSWFLANPSSFSLASQNKWMDECVATFG
ncbi:hypothetical protein [Vibrio crassostreae]|uniref:hypothetical protein n=1 Tax=Vibrio crassostreae TaxID=246167 RepID=UPI001B302ED3|nr:hypothetical protein [Vibrio crassostreae]